MKVKLPVSVVIPTMNRPKSFKRTIDFMMACGSIPSQIVVVDQSYKLEDQNENKISLFKYENEITCSYIYQEEASSTKARNAGFKKCEFDIIVYSDDDIDVNEDTILNVYNTMSDKNVSMIAGIDENSQSKGSILGYLSYNKSFVKRRIGHVTLSMFGRFPNGMNEDVVDTEWAMGYFFVIRKSLAESWGIYWDEKLVSYAYPEDLDYSYTYFKQSFKNGKRCIIHRSIKVKHLVNQDFRIPSYKATLMYVIHREYLSYKHFKTPISRLSTRWSNFCVFLLRLLSKQKPLDLLKAQYICDINRKDLKKGLIPIGVIK